MSPDQRKALRAIAASHGMTVRAWVMYRTLGIEDLQPGKPGRKPSQQDQLPRLTG